MGSSEQPGPVGLANGATADRRGVAAASRAVNVSFAGAAELTDEQKTLLLDVGQVVLDLIGIIEPTPFADTTNAAISAARSDWGGAGLSLLGTIPYVGDTAKASRLPRYLKIVERIVAEARQSPRFAASVRPALLRLYCALDTLPWSVLPEAARPAAESLRQRIVAHLGPTARAARARSLLAALRSKIDDSDGVLDVIEARVPQSVSLSSALLIDDFLGRLLGHLRNFDGKPTLKLTDKPTLAARASDEIRARDSGAYLVPTTDLAQAADRDKSAVAFAWNRMSALEIQEIPRGSIVLEGIAGAQAGLAGGGRQVAHLAQLSPQGRVAPPSERRIIDGTTRLAGGKTLFYPH